MLDILCVIISFICFNVTVIMAEGDLRIFLHLLKCTICTEDMTVARVLPCGHTFCHKCLEECLQHHVQNDEVPCPICHTRHKITKAGITGITKNVFVNKLLEAAHKQSATRETSNADLKVILNCSVEDCSLSAVTYCINCKEYICSKCEGHHKVSKITKNHKTLPIDQVKPNTLPPCHLHTHMYLDLYCEDCSIAICSTCDRLDHNHHTRVNINTKKDRFKSQLDQVFTQTDMHLKAVEKAIRSTKKKSIKLKAELDDLKKQTSVSFQAIIQHVKRQEQRHIEGIDNTYKRVVKIISEELDTYQRTEATLKSVQLYNRHLKQRGTVYDLMTNVKGLIDRCEKSGKEYNETKTLKCEVKVDWVECHFDVKEVRLIEGGDNAGLTIGSDPKITIFPTQWQSDISGIVAFHNHLIVVHYHHDVIYVYDDMMRLKSSIKISGMRNPRGLCLVERDATQHLVVANWGGQCLWWLRVEEQAGEVLLSQHIKHNLGYYPYSIVTDVTGCALVADYINNRLHVYSHPVQMGTCIQLPQSVQPRVAVSDPTGGYIISDQGYKLMWVTSDGQVTHRYTDQPAVSAYHMVHDGTDWLVTDHHNHCVHVVTGEGRHAGHLVPDQQGVGYPTCISVYIDNHCVWFGYRDQDGKKHMMKVEYLPPQITTLTMCATLPRAHT